MKRLLVPLLLLATAAPAGAFEIDKRIVPQPRVQYAVLVPDWRAPVKRVAKALNRAKVGVRLVEADIAQNASIQIGRLQRRCGFPGVNATTQTLVGGFAAIYMPTGCSPVQASIIAAHELGHALGLRHEDDGCALMNSSGTGPRSVPTGCLGRSIPWKSRPWRPDDLAGLRRLYRNVKPTVSLRLDSPTVAAGRPVTFTVRARDKDRNLSEGAIDYGDGERTEFFDAPPSTHTYLSPGTYTITVTVRDFYGRRATARRTVTVT